MFKWKNYVSDVVTTFLILQADNIVQQKEDEFIHSEVQLWMKSCKQMEQEKEMLQKQLVERDELLNNKNLAMTECRKEGT